MVTFFAFPQKNPSFSPCFRLNGKIKPSSSDKTLGANFMKFQIAALILMTLFLTSCGGKKDSSVVNLKLIKGAVAANGTTLNGGILLMGRSEDGKNSFRTGVMAADNVELDLPKGRWEFAAIAWLGTNGVMTGDNRCSYSGFVDLKDDQATVNFNLTMSNCVSTFNGSDFADSDYMNASGKFFDFTPTMCLDQTPGSAKCNNSVNASTLHTYQIAYKADMKGLVGGRIDPLTSQCFFINDVYKTSIPVTDNANENPLKPTIKFYKNTTCSGAADLTYNFDQSVLDTVLPNWSSITPSGSNAMFYVNPGSYFDAEVYPPEAITFNGLLVNDKSYFDTAAISFTIPNVPSNVKEFCATLSVCTDSDWRPIQSLGMPVDLGIALSDNSYQLIVFYKSQSGVVSGSSVGTFYHDAYAPMLVGKPTVSPSVSTINIAWFNGDSSAFKQWVVQICTDPSCSSPPVFEKALYDFNIKATYLTKAGDLVSLADGTYYARVKTIDVFNRYAYGMISDPFILTR